MNNKSLRHNESLQSKKDYFSLKEPLEFSDFIKMKNRGNKNGWVVARRIFRPDEEIVERRI